VTDILLKKWKASLKNKKLLQCNKEEFNGYPKSHHKHIQFCPTYRACINVGDPQKDISSICAETDAPN
jgi:hypothetical protein